MGLQRKTVYDDTETSQESPYQFYVKKIVLMMKEE
jgi:hypothetical protein